MKDIRIIFSDLDGTLLNSSHHVSPGVAQKLRRLRDEGILFYIVSARMPAAIRPVIGELGFPCPCICYGGALILDENGKETEQTRIDCASAREVILFARRHPEVSCFGAYEGDVWYAEEVSHPLIVTESRITAVTPEPFPSRLENLRPHKFMFIAPREEQCQRLMTDLERTFPALNVVYSGFGNIEVVAKGVSKSAAVKSVCARLGLPVSRAAAFGDSLNDADMLRAAGWGVAMGNASEAVKKAAKEVTLTNDEDGVLYSLNKIFGGK